MKKPSKTYSVIVNEAGEIIPMKFSMSFVDKFHLTTAKNLFGKIAPGFYTITVTKKYFGLTNIYRYEGRTYGF